MPSRIHRFDSDGPLTKGGVPTVAVLLRAIVNFFKVETVEKCSEEAATGDRRRADYVAVDVEEMKKVVAVHAVSLLELAEIESRVPCSCPYPGQSEGNPEHLRNRSGNS